MEISLPLMLKAFVAVVMASFFPAAGFVYLRYKLLANERNKKIFMDKVQQVSLAIPDQAMGSYVITLLFCTLVSLLGLELIFIGKELQVAETQNLLFDGLQNLRPIDADARTTREGALVAAGFAIIGAYMWGILRVSHRFFVNDLTSGLFLSIAMRMILAPVVALLVYHAAGALGADFGPAGANGSEGEFGQLFLLVAFFIGMFPQPAIRWLASKVPFAREDVDAQDSALPLSAVDGLTPYDESRLQEVGISNCLDLAMADFVAMMFATPYPPRKLVYWVLQAKLLVRFPDALEDLKVHGIHTILDLKNLTLDEIQKLAIQTRLTLSELTRAQEEAQTDPDDPRIFAYWRSSDSPDD